MVQIMIPVDKGTNYRFIEQVIKTTYNWLIDYQQLQWIFYRTYIFYIKELSYISNNKLIL